MLTLQPICRFSLASTFLFGCTCPQDPLAVRLRSRFVASGSIPLDHYFLPFSRHPYLYGPTALTPVLALQLADIVYLFFFFSAYPPIGFNYTGLNHGFTARPDCAVHRPSPFGPRFFSCLVGVPTASVPRFDPGLPSH